jgi:5-methylcytosine-specific restriction enzyme A
VTPDREAWAGSTRAANLPADWKARRARVLRRDPVCTLRTHCAGAPSVEVDHAGDKHDHRLEMLRGVCTDCHLHRTLAQAATARTAQAARPNRRLRPAERHPGLIEPGGG